MSNRRQFVCRTAAVLLACGLIASLLPGLAAVQDHSTREARMKQREVVFLDSPLAESPVMSLKDGILRIVQGGERVEVDWSGELPRISRR